MKKTIISLFAFAFFTATFSQDDSELKKTAKAITTEIPKEASDTAKWTKGGVFNLNFSQVSLNNWAAGGQSSVSGTGLLSLYASRKKGRSSWDNSLDLAYGLLKNQGESIRKSDDRIEFMSKYGKQLKKDGHWYLAGMLNFRTQFVDGFNFPNDSVAISTFMAPGYLMAGLGFDYRPSKNFSLYLSPATSKMTFVMDQTLADAGAFGVDPGKNFRFELGGYVKMFFTKDLMENITYTTKLDLFSNYLKNPQNIDVNWENLIAMKVNKYITVSISTMLIYDHDIQITDDNGKVGPRTQFKEVLAAGFTYKF